METPESMDLSDATIIDDLHQSIKRCTTRNCSAEISDFSPMNRKGASASERRLFSALGTCLALCDGPSGTFPALLDILDGHRISRLEAT
jgi:hypothetical protein